MFSQAQGYERFMGRWSRLLADLFVGFVDVSAARRVLDVGAGTGALARAVAQASTAEVVGIDPSPAFVEYARSRAIERARFEIGDAQELPFDDDSFDVCCALLVLNFLPRQERAIAQMRRVTKPGGTVAAGVWDHAQGMTMLRTFWDVADHVDPGPRAVEEPHPLLDQAGLIDLWTRAGFRNITSAPLTFDMRFASFGDYWEPFALGQGPAGAYLQSASLDARREIEEGLRARLLQGGKDGPFSLSARAWAVRGTKV